MSRCSGEDSRLTMTPSNLITLKTRWIIDLSDIFLTNSCTAITSSGCETAIARPKIRNFRVRSLLNARRVALRQFVVDRIGNLISDKLGIKLENLMVQNEDRPLNRYHSIPMTPLSPPRYHPWIVRVHFLGVLRKQAPVLSLPKYASWLSQSLQSSINLVSLNGDAPFRSERNPCLAHFSGLFLEFRGFYPRLCAEFRVFWSKTHRPAVSNSLVRAKILKKNRLHP